MKNLFTLALLTLITLTSCSKEETPDIIECYEIVEIKDIVVRITDREAEYFVELQFSNGIKWVSLGIGGKLFTMDTE
jgi:hypothetical protein